MRSPPSIKSPNSDRLSTQSKSNAIAPSIKSPNSDRLFSKNLSKAIVRSIKLLRINLC
ncbi:MAG: hypothetical protein IM556_04980 [Pseudanabaena sp. M110S1SP2A07QC]|nr:hypothetical protein [Pseudanabaena sp. M109S1SP2A07QC]MCA6517997.1 hypothetical protein [Pseudanabaena sp. M110S1SP2A07QC]